MTVVMMERSDDGEREIWGTWEDLLLAFAVLRHGAQDWDTVSKELRRRTRTPQARVTSQDCKNRYYGLRRRFEGIVQREIEDGEEVEGSVIPWMEQLRQVRVAELRREVQRIDVSIGSLESKLKTLTEEREQGREGRHTAGNGRADPDENREKSCDESPATPPVNVAGDHASGNRPGRWSCDESTSPRRDLTPVNGGGRVEPTGDQAMNPDPDPGGDEKGPAEGSCNGSSDTIAKVRNTAEEEEAKPAGAPPDSGESREAARENSDVQSSASLSKKLRSRRSKASVSGGSSGGDEADVVSPSEEGENKSRPLAGIFEMIRMNKHGSVFERRLEMQESARYRSMIRRHIDLDMIGSKLKGSLPCTTTEFFRDLLLLCNNAIVFFPGESSQHVAAARLRDLVNREIGTTNTGHNKPTTSEFPMAPPPSQPARMKSESDAENSVHGKRSTSPTQLFAFRRRNNYLSAKAATLAAAEPVVVGKEVDEEKVVEMDNAENKNKRELPVARGLRTTKARAATKKKIGVDVSNPKPIPGEEKSKTKERNDNNSGGNNAKKRSAASFLDRLKKGGLPSLTKSHPLPKNISSGGAGGGGKGGSNVQKKGGRGEGKKDLGSTRLASTRQAHREDATPIKRSVGRPPKRPSAKRTRATERDVSPLPTPSRGSSRSKKAKR